MKNIIPSHGSSLCQVEDILCALCKALNNHLLFYLSFPSVSYGRVTLTELGMRLEYRTQIFHPEYGRSYTLHTDGNCFRKT